MRPLASTPFLKDDNAFLTFSLTCRSSTQTAGEWLEIKDPVLALSLQNAVTLRLLMFDTECRKTDAKRIAYEVSKIFGDGKNGEPTSGLEPGVEIW